jgi:hypothetical protein
MKTLGMGGNNKWTPIANSSLLVCVCVCVIVQMPHLLALPLSGSAWPCHIVIWSLKILGRCVISFLWADSTQKEKKKESRHIWQRKVPTSTTKFEGNKMLVYLICKPHPSLSCLSPPTPPHPTPPHPTPPHPTPQLANKFQNHFFCFFPGLLFKKLYIVSFVFGKS